MSPQRRRRTAQQLHRVVTVLDRRVSMFELSVPCEVFGLDRPELGPAFYQHEIAAAVPGTLDTENGATLVVQSGLEALETADTIVVGPPARGVPQEETQIWHNPDLLEALRVAHERGARLVSLCSGAFVLAEAGLLDGRRATTHWMYSAEFARRYPKVDLDPGVLYVDEGSILTSAGTAGAIDLCLHIVRLDCGAEVANAVARRMVVPPHRDGGQAQYVDTPIPTISESDTLGEAMAWAVEHLAEDISVAELSRRAAMSERTFARRFAAATGTTPHQWLLAQRVLLAQRLLETTEESVERVAESSGFGSAAGLRQHFEKKLRCSPQRYRRTFRARTTTSR